MIGGIAQTALQRPPVRARQRLTGVRLEPRLAWRLTHAVADFATVFFTGMATYGLYLAFGLGRRHFAPELYAQLSVALACITVFALQGHGAYRGQLGLLRIEAVRRIIRSVFTSLCLLLVLTLLLRLPGFSRLTLLLLAPSITIALVIERSLLAALRTRVRGWLGRSIPVLIYGAGATGRLLARQLLEDHSLGLRPLGFVDDNPELQAATIRVGAGPEGERLRVFADGARLPEIAEELHVGAVFLALPSLRQGQISTLVAQLEKAGLPYFLIPTSQNMTFLRYQFGQVGAVPVVSPRWPAARPFYESTKRILDIVVSALLLALTSPIVGIAAVFIKLTSAGPVFFKQERIGLNGAPFTIYKLRTMRADAPKYAYHPETSEDPRVTPVGRWLRRLSIDELPQLWNVLKGDMSLVGPRPEMPFVVAQYGDVERQRLLVKPGLTGLWQISRDRALMIHANIQYDLYYVDNRSWSMDLAILLLTFSAVLRQTGR